MKKESVSKTENIIERVVCMQQGHSFDNMFWGDFLISICSRCGKLIKHDEKYIAKKQSASKSS